MTSPECERACVLSWRTKRRTIRPGYREACEACSQTVDAADQDDAVEEGVQVAHAAQRWGVEAEEGEADERAEFRDAHQHADGLAPDEDSRHGREADGKQCREEVDGA